MQIETFTTDKSSEFTGLKAGLNYVILSSPVKIEVEDSPTARFGDHTRHVVTACTMEGPAKSADIATEAPAPAKPNFAIPAIVPKTDAPKPAPDTADKSSK